jgi:DNA-binding IclR family transcriptional regulator
MLAALPREQVRASFPDATALTQRHGSGPATPRALREVLREVRAAGFAREDGEVTPGFRSVAAAVLDHAGWPAAAVAITWPSDGPERDAASLADAATTTAAELARRIGRHA